jgi:uncharacterized protein
LAGELESQHRVSTQVIVADLSTPEGVEAVGESLRMPSARVDLLVNNAGIAMFGPFLEADPATQVEMMELNVVALTRLTRMLTPPMVERRSGGIINVGSTAAFQPGPLMAVYYATNAYVLSFSVALAEKLRGTGVTVTCLCPPSVESGFQERAGMQESRLVKGRKLPSARSAALAGYAGFKRRKVVVIPGLRNRVMAAGAKMAPATLSAPAVRAAQSVVRP